MSVTFFEATRMYHGFGPLKGYRMLITRIGESANGLAYLVGVRGGQAAQDGLGQDAEPHLHLVKPGGMGRRVMEIDQGVACQPPVMLGLMSAQIVEDHMQLRFGMLGYHPVHEVQELPAAAATVVAHRYRPGMDFQGGKEGGGPVALVFMVMPAHRLPVGGGAATPGRAQGLGWRASRPR